MNCTTTAMSTTQAPLVGWRWRQWKSCGSSQSTDTTSDIPRWYQMVTDGVTDICAPRRCPATTWRLSRKNVSTTQWPVFQDFIEDLSLELVGDVRSARVPLYTYSKYDKITKLSTSLQGMFYLLYNDASHLKFGWETLKLCPFQLKPYCFLRLKVDFLNFFRNWLRLSCNGFIIKWVSRDFLRNKFFPHTCCLHFY